MKIPEINGITPGSIVLHRPSGEEWIVGAVCELSGDLSPDGWPPTVSKASDCDLVEKATPERAEDKILLWAHKRTAQHDWRRSVNYQLVEDENKEKCTEMMRT